ncbi:YqzL family protein [Thalassorhabdus alkalitolerans]|uniref:YqzL family protein n=1 Tax=Thalassorhabdus alkalitolerans TaxID=2282697 RepID=A0ABW0YRS1_9BACI|nr:MULTISPECIES: YqzL family protein [Bacillaceae]
MLDFSWKVFSITGNVDTYLLIKEIEQDMGTEEALPLSEENTPLDSTPN